MHKLCLGAKSGSVYGVIVSLPRSIVNLTSHAKVAGDLILSDEDYQFAMCHGLGKLIADGLVAEKVSAKAVKPAPQKIMEVENIEIPTNSAIQEEEPVSIMELQEQVITGEASEQSEVAEPAEEPVKKKKKAKKSE